MRRTGLTVVLTMALAARAVLAQEPCRQALALGLDVSGSVDMEEYRLQLDGLAGALLNEQVRAALLAMPSAPVALAVFEWSGREDQRLILPWTSVDNAGTLNRIAARLRGSSRSVGSRTTAIGAALLSGAGLLAERPLCWKRTLDLSGDGRSNDGPRPRDVRGDARVSQITVNALVIGGDKTPATDQETGGKDDLTAYFRAEVIVGPDAFVEEAQGFADFEAAMVRKLLKELSGLNVAAGTQ